MCVQKLKSAALPDPEIGGTPKIWAVPWYAHAPFSQKCSMGFSSEASYVEVTLVECVRVYVSKLNLWFLCRWRPLQQFIENILRPFPNHTVSAELILGGGTNSNPSHKLSFITKLADFLNHFTGTLGGSFVQKLSLKILLRCEKVEKNISKMLAKG